MKKLSCILLIEDDHLTNIYNRKIIEKLSVTGEICIVKNGQEGLDYLSRKENHHAVQNGFVKPELILLDINMPGMSGWEFVEEYNKLGNETKENVKIIFLTSSPNPDDIKRAALIPGINGFETKPLTKEKMMEIIEKYFA